MPFTAHIVEQGTKSLQTTDKRETEKLFVSCSKSSRC